MKFYEDIIIKPVLTEKSYATMSEKRYVFEVAASATKTQIKAAVEQIFGVEVEKVNTMIVPKKPKRRGVSVGFTSEWKKAVVTLTAESKTIEFFDGMR